MLSNKKPLSEDTPDVDLFKHISKGNKIAFTIAYDRYHRMLYTIAFRYLMNSEMAQDIVQHVYTRLWEYREDISIGISLKNYLYTMTKNYTINTIRDNNTVVVKNYEIAQTTEVYEDNLVAKLEEKEMIDTLYKAINNLPAQKREVCMLKINEGLTNKEIAERMEISINTVKTHYLESLKILRSSIGKLIIIVNIITLLSH